MDFVGSQIYLKVISDYKSFFKENL